MIKLKWLFDVSSIFKLAKILKEKNIDILHTHGYKANVIGALAAKLTAKTICIRTEHGLTEPFYGYDRLKMNFYNSLDYLSARYLTRRIISVCSEIGQNVITKYPRNRIATVCNGINVSVPQMGNGKRLKEQLGLAKDNYVLGIVGRLVPVKGHHYFIDAARSILQKRQDARFLIVGDGPLRPALESRVNSLGLSEYIKFTGFRDDVKEIIQIMDIVVFSSLREGIPYALLEAMLSRKAIVATRVGGLAEVISDGINGLLIKDRNSREITQGCLYLLENREILRNLGRAAAQTVQDNFSADKMKERTVRIYEESLAN